MPNATVHVCMYACRIIVSLTIGRSVPISESSLKCESVQVVCNDGLSTTGFAAL
jgi:hypothetical protein